MKSTTRITLVSADHLCFMGGEAQYNSDVSEGTQVRYPVYLCSWLKKIANTVSLSVFSNLGRYLSEYDKIRKLCGEQKILQIGKMILMFKKDFSGDFNSQEKQLGCRCTVYNILLCY